MARRSGSWVAWLVGGRALARTLRPSRSIPLWIFAVPCTCPLNGYPAPPGAPNRKLVFSAHRSYAGARSFAVPCGQCRGCRLDRARDWATRAVHEAACHDRNCFVTLTINDDHLPPDGSVSLRQLQLFKKRLRFNTGPFRDLSCGEYGDRTLRPHYHGLLFGIDFPDKRPWRRSASGELLYRSAELEKSWPYGEALIGAVTFQSASYVARYTMKKAKGEKDPNVYRRTAFDPTTGELREWFVAPEFLVMSRNPGLGSEWFNRFRNDAFPSDFLIVDGRKVPVPRFYTDRLARESEAAVLAVKARRKLNGFRHADNNTERRLMTRHESQALRAERLVRSLDADS